MTVIKLDKTNSAEFMNRSDYIMHMIEILVDESKIIKKNAQLILFSSIVIVYLLTFNTFGHSTLA